LGVVRRIEPPGCVTSTRLSANAAWSSMCSITSLETTSSHCPTDGSAMTSRERDVGNAARAFAMGSTDRSKAVTAFDDSATLTRPLRRCGRVAVRDRRARALLVDELGVPVDRVVDARHTAVGAGDSQEGSGICQEGRHRITASVVTIASRATRAVRATRGAADARGPRGVAPGGGA